MLWDTRNASGVQTTASARALNRPEPPLHDAQEGGAGLGQLVGRGTEERTPTRMVGFWPGNFYLENYDVS